MHESLFRDFPVAHLMKYQWLWTGLISMHHHCLSYRTACLKEHRYSQEDKHNICSREFDITPIIQGSLALFPFREGSTHAFHHLGFSLSLVTDIFPNPRLVLLYNTFPKFCLNATTLIKTSQHSASQSCRPIGSYDSHLLPQKFCLLGIEIDFSHLSI